MRRCDQQLAVVDYFFNELPTAQRAIFEDHLTHCALCQQHLQDLKVAGQAIKNYRRPAPDATLLDNYHRQLQQTFGSPAMAGQWSWNNFIERVLRRPSLAWRLAEATIILALGIVLGRIFFGQSVIITTPQVTENISTSLFVAPSLLQNYLQETEMVLLDVDNLDPIADQMVIVNLIQSAKYKYLIQKTLLLKELAQKSGDQQMIQLLSQVELILLELCNLEPSAGSETFLQLQQQLKEKRLLMQIKSLKQQAI